MPRFIRLKGLWEKQGPLLALIAFISVVFVIQMALGGPAYGDFMGGTLGVAYGTHLGGFVGGMVLACTLIPKPGVAHLR